MNSEKVEVKVVSYNVCGKDDKDDLVEIFDALLKYNPDILAIQGLTRLNCEAVFRLLKSSGFSYSRFDQTSTPREDFEIIFAKVPVLKKEFTPFVKSAENRGISKYMVTVGSRTENPVNVYFFTSQFDSGNIQRKTQILELDAEKTKCTRGGQVKQVIFAGDTKIPSWQEHALKAPVGWKDAWREKGTSQNEKTSLLDRSDQIWLSEPSDESDVNTLSIIDFQRVRIDKSDETRAGVYALIARVS